MAVRCESIVFSDIHKYDQVMSYFEARDSERKQDKMKFYQRGVREGVFRDDVDYDVLSRILNASIEYVKQSKMYKEYDLPVSSTISSFFSYAVYAHTTVSGSLTPC